MGLWWAGIPVLFRASQSVVYTFNGKPCALLRAKSLNGNVTPLQSPSRCVLEKDDSKRTRLLPERVFEETDFFKREFIRVPGPAVRSRPGYAHVYLGTFFRTL